MLRHDLYDPLLNVLYHSMQDLKLNEMVESLSEQNLQIKR